MIVEAPVACKVKAHYGGFDEASEKEGLANNRPTLQKPVCLHECFSVPLMDTIVPQCNAKWNRRSWGALHGGLVV